MRILVAGWFSFERMGATAGDLLACDVVCSWLSRAGIAHDRAHAAPFEGGVDWRSAEPSGYTHVAFVCGPFGNGDPLLGFLERFRNCRWIGIDLTMLQSLEEWNPFELLLERDSSRTARPDLAFLAPLRLVPIVGVILIHPQPEYGPRDSHQHANGALQRLLARQECAAVPIDTRLDENSTGLRTSAEVESLIATMDMVVTTRLHGMVLALKNGVPPVVVDPVQGGAKIVRQAETIEWPLIFTTETATDSALDMAWNVALSTDTRELAGRTAARARRLLEDVPSRFIHYLQA